MSATYAQDRARFLLAELKKLREDRGAMANLRRGFSPGTDHRAWPWIARWCNLTSDRQRMIYTTVAAAFATHPETADTGNLGATLRRIALGDQSDKDQALQSFEARFRRFLTCSRAEEVCRRLTSVVRAAAQGGIPINYEQLFIDLWFWDDYPGRVKVQWAAAYWGGQREEVSI